MARLIGPGNVITEIPRSTLFQLHRGLKGKAITVENTWNSSGILGKLDLSLLQDTIIMRDRKSDGVNGCECITAITDLTGASFKESTQCYNYLIKKGYLPRLRTGGRMRKVLATTTKQLQITTISMRRWHNCLSAVYEEQL